jgi:hypothetical protein
VLFDRADGDQAQHEYSFSLPDAMDTVLGLNVCLRVPVAVEKDDLNGDRGALRKRGPEWAAEQFLTKGKG